MTNYRSMLFVPGDNEKMIQKGLALKADALIFDLEDAVMPENRVEARALVLKTLLDTQDGYSGPKRFVRVNPFESDEPLLDLAAIMPGAPDGIVQPKIKSVDCVNKMGNYLDVLEASAGLEIGSTKILAVATETPEIMFKLGGLKDATDRLIAINWGGEDLSAAILASTNREMDGDWAFTYKLARSLCLLAARAADIEPLDTVHTDFRDLDALRAECIAARKEGFSGKIAIHPIQVDIINESFTPSDEDVTHAQRIMDAFDAAGGAGAIQLDGQMLDMPHIKQARHVLSQAAALKER
jgi:citrate lyase subunit beta/citryl-CoA lyase